jgi:iron complex transport system substrate-binding protein
MQPRNFDGGRIAGDAEMSVLTLSRRLLAALALLAVQVTVDAGTIPAAAYQDDRGRSVAMAQVPQRIVSLLPSLTESVCALGACHKLVGIDRYSTWPPDVSSRLPIVGGSLDPNVEAIVALKPDVVLVSGAARVTERLEALGLRTLVLESHTQADVHRVLHSIGIVLGLPPQQGAEHVWQHVQAGMDAAARSVPDSVKGARVYFEVSRGPYAAGPSSFIGELLTQMGVGNVVSADMGPFPRLNPEFILRARPDVILMGNHSMQLAHTYPGWHTLEAVKQQRLCGFDAQESGIIVRPGPRMDEAARIIAHCLTEKAPRRAR